MAFGDDFRHIVTADDLTASPVPIRELLEGFFVAGRVQFLAADGGEGKSIFLVGFALHRALGLPYLGLKTSPGCTVIITAEDSRDDILHIMRVWCRVDPRLLEARDRILIIDLNALHSDTGDGASMPMLVNTIGRRYEENAAFIDNQIVPAITTANLPSFPDLIIWETTARSGADESALGASATVKAFERISRRCRGSAVIASHHIGQEAARNRTLDQHTLRGSTAFVNNSRGVVYLAKPSVRAVAKFLRRDPDDIEDEELESSPYLTLARRKNNRLGQGDDIFLRRDPYKPDTEPKSIGATFARVYTDAARSAADLQKRVQRVEMIRKLRAFVEKVAPEGATCNFLKDHPERPSGIPEKKMRTWLERAVDDGALERVESEGRQGGGYLYRVSTSNVVDFSSIIGKQE